MIILQTNKYGHLVLHVAILCTSERYLLAVGLVSYFRAQSGVQEGNTGRDSEISFLKINLKHVLLVLKIALKLWNCGCVGFEFRPWDILHPHFMAMYRPT